jgi:peptide/nickel transport system substrate-binding protein
MIEALGYVKGPDGFFRDAAGQRLSVEIRTTASEDIQVKSLFAIADGWQRIGIGVETLLISPQRNQDRADRANRPAFLVTGGPAHMDILLRYHSRDAAVQENNYAGGNQGRYQNPEYDALYERYVSTIPRTERMQLAGQILRHISEQLPDFLIFYRMQSIMIANRFTNITGVPRNSSPSWNAQEWDIS